MKRDIKLSALDLDGTFLDEKKHISKENELAVRRAMENGVQVVISTGRALSGIPLDEIKRLGIQYVITANGAAIYKLPEEECLYSDCMDTDLSCEIVEELKRLQINVSAHINGACYTDRSEYDQIEMLKVSEVIKNFLRSSRIVVDDLAEYIRENQAEVQKFALIFFNDEDGNLKNHDEVYRKYVNDERICMVTGGKSNLELSKCGVTKGNGLRILADMLGIDMEQTMACGDTQNDMDIIRAAAVGVAMSNATEDVKKEADFITLSNVEHGVAYAIEKLVLE